MTNNIVPFDDQPSTGEKHHQPGDNERQNGGRQRRRRHIYSRDECLEMLTQIPGMLKAGLITPAEANAIRPVLQAILAEHQSNRPAPGSQKELPAKVLDIVRENPELQTWFEPFLSESDIANMMKGDER